MISNYSPLLLRDYISKRKSKEEITPLKTRTNSSSHKGHHYQNSLGGSTFQAEERKSAHSRFQSKNNESFEKELLEFKIATPSSEESLHPKNRLVAKYLSFDRQQFEKNSFVKKPDELSFDKYLFCKIHEERFTFLCPDEKTLLCPRCFLHKYDKVLAHSRKSSRSLIPLESALEWMNKENKNFVKFEGRQYILQIEHSISNCQLNNNIYLKKLDIFQKLISQEFQEIYQYLAKREAELRDYVQLFFSLKIKENVDQLQELKFLQESFQKLVDLNTGTNLEQAVFQFSFTNSLKKTLQQASLHAAKVQEKDLEIIDFISKKRIKQEIDSLGKPLTKFNEGFITPGRSLSPKRRSASPSPIRSNSQTINNASNKIAASPLIIPIINHKALEKISIEKLPDSYKPLDCKKRQILQSHLPYLQERDLFSDSKIITDPQLKHEALEMFPIKFKSTEKLYNLSTVGLGSSTFHDCCDDKGPCILIAKAEGKYIFGFYSPLNLIKEEKYCGHEGFFIFSLRNDLQRPLVFKVKQEKNFIALYNSAKSPCLGSTLPNKEDLFIDFDVLENSRSNIGYAYKLWDTKLDGSKVLCGKSGGWTFDEIEVYRIVQVINLQLYFYDTNLMQIFKLQPIVKLSLVSLCPFKNQFIDSRCLGTQLFFIKIKSIISQWGVLIIR